MTADRAAGPTVLDVRDLSVRFRMRGGRDIAAVTDARFSVAPGECLALVGESGCGKSVLASALLGLLPANARTTGSALLGGETDLLTAGSGRWPVPYGDGASASYRRAPPPISRPCAPSAPSWRRPSAS